MIYILHYKILRTTADTSLLFLTHHVEQAACIQLNDLIAHQCTWGLFSEGFIGERTFHKNTVQHYLSDRLLCRDNEQRIFLSLFPFLPTLCSAHCGCWKRELAEQIHTNETPWYSTCCALWDTVACPAARSWSYGGLHIKLELVVDFMAGFQINFCGCWTIVTSC